MRKANEVILFTCHACEVQYGLGELGISDCNNLPEKVSCPDCSTDLHYDHTSEEWVTKEEYERLQAIDSFSSRYE